MITQFTPIASTIGGVLIGIAAVMLMLFTGRIAGISGIAARLFPPYYDSDAIGATAFVTGLMLAPLAYMLTTGNAVMQTVWKPQAKLACGRLTLAPRSQSPRAF